jgi:hypothetical protein
VKDDAGRLQDILEAVSRIEPSAAQTCVLCRSAAFSRNSPTSRRVSKGRETLRYLYFDMRAELRSTTWQKLERSRTPPSCA